MYDIHLWKSLVSEDKLTRTTTERKAIFTDLDDNTEYQFQVRANTRKGPGPWSTKVSFRTDRNIIRAPLRVQVSVFFRIRVIYFSESIQEVNLSKYSNFQHIFIPIFRQWLPQTALLKYGGKLYLCVHEL